MLQRVLKNDIELSIREAEERDALEIVNMFKQMGGESENLTFGHNDYYYNESQEKLFIKTLKERLSTHCCTRKSEIRKSYVYNWCQKLKKKI